MSELYENPEPKGAGNVGISEACGQENRKTSITCEACGTKFRLDPARLKRPRTRVRCTLCGHVFFVEAPEEGKRNRALTRRTLGGVLWSFSGIGLRVVLQAGTVVVLARLLTPRDFGIVSAALAVVTFADIALQGGMGQAIIQRPSLETRHLQTGFTLSCLMGLLMFGLLSLLAPIIADLFRIYDLSSVLPLISVALIFRGMSLVAEALLQREMKFRQIAMIEAVSYSLGYGAAGISLALVGFGALALVGAHIVQTAMRSSLLILVQPHAKSPRFDRSAYGELMYTGFGFFLGRSFNALAGQGGYMVIGRFLGAEALGIYSRAYQLIGAPASMFGMALDKVLFPVMSKVQDEPAQLRKAYTRAVALVALITLPASITMYVLAPEIVALLFGPKWMEVVAPCKVLAIAILFRASYRISDSLTRATGGAYERAGRQVLYAGMVIGGAYIGHFWGVPGAAFGILAAIFANFVSMAHLSLETLGSMSWKNFLAAHSASFFLALIVWAELIASTSILRELSMPIMVVLAGPIVLVLVTIILLVHLVPHRILGEEGSQMVRVLSNSLPARYNVFKLIKVSP